MYGSFHDSLDQGGTWYRQFWSDLQDCELILTVTNRRIDLSKSIIPNRLFRIDLEEILHQIL
ncbi:hypothetical protein MJO28_017726 [Puccinia striiformis f. sp. tritici]|nr:hypothetical protein MJO28_017726 [Puccinia striiformis f. sp. tritici]